MGNIFNTFSYKKEHINVKKIQKSEKVTSRVKMRNRKKPSKFKDYFPEILYCPL
jgi:hypothetical protein